ncbi:MAG: hypothetical protein ACJAXX_003120 [Roseivirga sp.]|jgi:hypothetical protein
MKKVLLSSLMLLLMNVCLGQSTGINDTTKSFKNRGAGMHLIIPKVEFSSSSGLNPLLSQYDYPTLPKTTFNWGLGIQYRWGFFLVNADLMLAHQHRENMEIGTELRRSILSTNLFLSYYVHDVKINDSRSMYFYPFFGISTNDTNLFLSRSSNDQSIDALLASPENTLQLEHFAGGFAIGLGVDITSLFEESAGIVSLKIGYRFNPEDSYAWESSFTNILGLPSDSMNQFFIQLNLIGGVVNWKR